MAYIEREKLMAELQKKIELSHNARRAVIEEDFEDIINDIPAADVVEVRHGKWDINKNCSVCGVSKFEGLDADVWADWDIDYCPHCGAKMDGKDGE